jgi:hypothetical protein
MENIGRRVRAALLEHGLAVESELRGCSEDSIEKAKEKQGVRFLPSVYVDFALEIGSFAGELFLGSDYSCAARCTRFRQI